jgi:hypothetical protein
VLITDVPGVLSEPAPELNATQEQSEDKDSRENAQAKFTNPVGTDRTAEE